MSRHEYEPTTSPARYVTVRDYVRVIRRYWIMIVGSRDHRCGRRIRGASGSSPSTQATAEVTSGSESERSVVGLGSSTAETPAQMRRSRPGAVTGQAVMTQVKRQLRSSLSVGRVRARSRPQASQQSGLLAITATGSSPHSRPRLADTAPRTLVAQENRHARASSLRVAADIRARIAQLRPITVGLTRRPAHLLRERAREDEHARRIATSAQLEKLAQRRPPQAPPHVVAARCSGLALGLLLGVVVRVRSRLDGPPAAQSAGDRLVVPAAAARIRRQAEHGTDRGGDQGSRAKRRARPRAVQDPAPKCRASRPPQPARIHPRDERGSRGGQDHRRELARVREASAGKRTLLVDCDLRRPTSRAARVESSPGISEYLAGAASPEQILQDGRVRRDARRGGRAAPSFVTAAAPSGSRRRLVCIPSGARTSRATELLGSERFREFLAEVCQSLRRGGARFESAAPGRGHSGDGAPRRRVVVCARESRRRVSRPWRRGLRWAGSRSARPAWS